MFDDGRFGILCNPRPQVISETAAFCGFFSAWKLSSRPVAHLGNVDDHLGNSQPCVRSAETVVVAFSPFDPR
jgi:hypothetical protein